MSDKETYFINAAKDFDQSVDLFVSEIKRQIDKQYRYDNLTWFLNAMGRNITQCEVNFQKSHNVKIGWWDGHVMNVIISTFSKVSFNTTYLTDAICREVRNRVADYFESKFKTLLLGTLVGRGRALQYPNGIYVLDYNLPNGKGDLSVVHYCDKRKEYYHDNGYVHRPALRLRCDFCKAHMGKAMKATALLKLKMKEVEL